MPRVPSPSGAEPRATSSQPASAPPVLPQLREMERLISTLVGSWCPLPTSGQNRRWQRVRYEKPIAVTPLEEQTDEPIGRPMRACGRDLSPGGISFTHHRPLPYRTVAVSFDFEDEKTVETVVARLIWCRYTRGGLYLDGGRILRRLTLPGLREIEWAQLPAL